MSLPVTRECYQHTAGRAACSHDAPGTSRTVCVTTSLHSSGVCRFRDFSQAEEEMRRSRSQAQYMARAAAWEQEKAEAVHTKASCL